MITAMNATLLVHILLTTLTFCVLCLAAIQAVLLAWQEYELRKPRVTGIFTQLPPLEKMESLLFRTITAGFVLLTIVFVSSLISFHFYANHFLWPKLLVSLFAWIIFFLLLGGRHYLGWRGPRAIRWTLIGVFLVMIIYFGSLLL